MRAHPTHRALLLLAVIAGSASARAIAVDGPQSAPAHGTEGPAASGAEGAEASGAERAEVSGAERAEVSGAERAGAIQPFLAHYTAQWKNISVGVSDLELKRGAAPGHYEYRWVISARGIFHLVYAHDVIQQSWFAITGKHVKPERYLGEEGDSSVTFAFDWATARARGTSEGKPIDIALKPGSQDLMSIQVEVMLDLQNDSLAGTFYIVDKDQLKDFSYERAPPQRLRTEIGSFDTLVVSSRRPGNDRVLTLWFAPSLGFVPVQAERMRGGKLEFAMRIRSLQRAGRTYRPREEPEENER